MFTFPMTMMMGATEDYDADAQAYIDRLTGTYSTAELDAINDFFVSLKDDSLYSDIVACRIYALDNASDALLNIKGTSHTATQTNMTFTARQGFAGNGSTSFIDTNVTPSTSGLTQNSATYGFYKRDFGDTGGTDMAGRVGSGAAAISLRTSDGGTAVALSTINSDSIPVGIQTTNPTGMQLYSRTASNLTTLYSRGVSQGTTSIASTGLPTVRTYLGGGHNNYSLNNSSSDEYALDVIASGWDTAQAANFSNHAENLLDAFGAGVVA